MDSSTSPVRRVAWLLRANRTLAADVALRSGRTFARAFRPDRPLASSHVTRWEAGSLSPSRDTIRRYEELLTLPTGSLTAISDTVQRLGDAVADPAPVDATEDARRQLHELLDQASTPAAMSGLDWTELSRLVAARQGLELHPPMLWDTIANQLLSELVVAVDNSWLQRQEAMSRLLEHPSAKRHAIDACVLLAEDPASPAVVEPLSLLNVTDDPRANMCVLSMLDAPVDDRALHGALLAVVPKVCRGHFRAPDWPRLTGSINGIVRDPSTSEAMLLGVVDVARHLLRRFPSASQLRRSLESSRVVEHLRRVSPGPWTRELSVRLARRAQAEVADERDPSDDMLANTIDDAIFGVNPDDRLFATMLLAATPYRLPVANVLLAALVNDVTRRTSVYPLPVVLRALTQLGVDDHRPLVRTLLLRPDGDVATRRAAAAALPHCSGRYPGRVWREIFRAQADQAVLQSVVYGMGTDGHRDLLTEIGTDPHLPEPVRAMASWQLSATAPVP